MKYILHYLKITFILLLYKIRTLFLFSLISDWVGYIVGKVHYKRIKDQGD